MVCPRQNAIFGIVTAQPGGVIPSNYHWLQFVANLNVGPPIALRSTGFNDQKYLPGRRDQRKKLKIQLLIVCFVLTGDELTLFDF